MIVIPIVHHLLSYAAQTVMKRKGIGCTSAKRKLGVNSIVVMHQRWSQSVPVPSQSRSMPVLKATYRLVPSFAGTRFVEGRLCNKMW